MPGTTLLSKDNPNHLQHKTHKLMDHIFTQIPREDLERLIEVCENGGINGQDPAKGPLAILAGENEHEKIKKFFRNHGVKEEDLSSLHLIQEFCSRILPSQTNISSTEVKMIWKHAKFAIAKMQGSRIPGLQ